MIGARLKSLRKEKRISQRELAEIIGVRKSAVSLYETDKNNPYDPIKITLVKYFDVSLDYLIGVIDDKVKYYSENGFIKLPENMSSEDIQLVKKFIQFNE